MGCAFKDGPLMLELLQRCYEWNHDFRTDIDTTTFRSDSSLKYCASLHLGDLGIRDSEATSAMAEHWIRLSKTIDHSVEFGAREPKGAREKLALLAAVREEFVKRRIEKTNRHRQSVHRFEDSLEVA